MRFAIIDNSTLTAVQRLLGDIAIYNKHAIDGDILAFETLIQAILFFDEVYYINDYKSEYRDERSHYFNGFGQLNIEQKSYETLLNETTRIADNVIPEIEGGVFTDSNFQPFFELLKMHNIFTWDMSSSVYYLTQKMLANSNSEIDIEKYSKLNEMIFAEYNDHFIKQKSNKFIVIDSKGTTVTDQYYIQDKEGKRQEAYIGRQTELFMANLSWLAYRTIFYTLVARENGGTLVLHPIRNAFQINFLSRLSSNSTSYFRNLISALNTPVEETVRAIFEPTQPLITKLPLPLFSVRFSSITGNPKDAIKIALDMKLENEFVEARGRLRELEQLYVDGNPQTAIQMANKLLLEVRKLLERINTKYYVTTPQGVSISPLIVAYNLGAVASSGALPTIPNYSAKIKFLDKLKDLIPQKGFNAVYKSLINDLTQIERLGGYHELLTSQIVYHKNASFYSSKEEDVKYRHTKSSWKIPL